MFEKQESERLASRGTEMIKKYVAMGLGALIAVAPVAAMANTSTKSHTAIAQDPQDPHGLEDHKMTKAPAKS